MRLSFRFDQVFSSYALFQKISHPVRVNAIPRQIPPPPKYLRPWVRHDIIPVIFVLLLIRKSGDSPTGRHSPVWCCICRTIFCAIELVCLEGVLRLRFSCPDRRRRRLDHCHGHNLVHVLPSLRRRVPVRSLSVDGLVPINHALAPRWHWRAFVTGGGSAFWLLAYGLFYWVSRLSLDSFSSVILYLGYLFLLVILDFLVTGQSFGPHWSPIDLMVMHRYYWVLGCLLGNTEVVLFD